jgi:undecaprenyl diphosphate synthase
MDGNGRYVKERGFLRAIGHESGTKSVRNTVEACSESGINSIPDRFSATLMPPSP